MFKKLLAILMVSAALMYILKGYFFVVLGIVILIILIRFIADIFWWGKDNGKW